MNPCLWLSIDASSWHHDAEKGKGTAHLNFEQADELISQLEWLKANHYQVEK